MAPVSKATLAIDFGTSNTVVAVWDPVQAAPRLLSFPGLSRQEQAHSAIPSLVYVKGKNQLLVGETVRAGRWGAVDPQRLFQGFKRELVAEFVPPPRVLDGERYDAERVAQAFLQAVMEAVQKEGLQPQQVVFTAPVGSFERYLNWLRRVAGACGWDPIQIVDEATAAALGYAVGQPGSVVLVVDFGGGTLDLSLVRTLAPQAGNSVLKAEVIAKADAYVGGVDIDIWIAEYLLGQLGLSRQQLGALSWITLLEQAEQLKIALSTQPEAVSSWFDDEALTAYELRLDRQALEEILEAHQLLDQIRQCLDDVLLTAQARGLAKSQIEQVLLVGGSSQLPAVQELLRSYFGKKKVRCERPFDAVALGALQVGCQVKLEDRLHHSYAIRLWDPLQKSYIYYPLFERGSPYPCRRSEPLILQVANDGQTEVRLDVGEVAQVAQAEVVYDELGRMSSRQLTRQTDFRSLTLGTEPACLARLQPPGRVGEDRLRVEFAIDASRRLLATIIDLQTQQPLVEAQPVATLS
ncbi:Hsp70 family protein [Synechococcus sp. O70.1]|uniref:Hsp70 family protein n=1 Tax=unclassified Synechococcus TaxID=2626047 RepID=UPI0039C458E7